MSLSSRQEWVEAQERDLQKALDESLYGFSARYADGTRIDPVSLMPDDAHRKRCEVARKQGKVFRESLGL